MYYLRILIHGDCAIAYLGEGLGWSQGVALANYRAMLEAGYKFDLCQLWHNGEFLYTII